MDEQKLSGAIDLKAKRDTALFLSYAIETEWGLVQAQGETTDRIKTTITLENGNLKTVIVIPFEWLMNLHDHFRGLHNLYKEEFNVL